MMMMTQLATAGLARCAFFARFHKVTKLPTVQCRVTVFMQQRRNDGAETTTPDTCRPMSCSKQQKHGIERCSQQRSMVIIHRCALFI